jgi:hypothetical protein
MFHWSRSFLRRLLRVHGLLALVVALPALGQEPTPDYVTRSDTFIKAFYAHYGRGFANDDPHLSGFRPELIARVRELRACVAGGKQCIDPFTCQAYGATTVRQVSPVGVVEGVYVADVTVVGGGGAAVVRWGIRIGAEKPIVSMNCPNLASPSPSFSPPSPPTSSAPPSAALNQDRGKRAFIFLAEATKRESAGDGPGMVKLIEQSGTNDLGVEYLGGLKACMVSARNGEPCTASPLTCQPLQAAVKIDTDMDLIPDGVRLTINGPIETTVDVVFNADRRITSVKCRRAPETTSPSRASSSSSSPASADLLPNPLGAGSCSGHPGYCGSGFGGCPKGCYFNARNRTCSGVPNSCSGRNQAECTGGCQWIPFR